MPFVPIIPKVSRLAAGRRASRNRTPPFSLQHNSGSSPDLETRLSKALSSPASPRLFQRRVENASQESMKMAVENGVACIDKKGIERTNKNYIPDFDMDVRFI